MPRKSPHIYFRCALLTAAVLLLAGCASTPQPTVMHSFMLQLPATARAAPLAACTLALSPVTVLAPYSGKSLVIRSGEVAYTLDPYNEWVAHPAAMWRNVLEGWLSERRLFSRLLPAGGPLPGCTLDVTVLEASVDRRPNQPPQAVVRLRLFLQKAGSSNALLLDRSFRAARPVPALTPDDEVAALSQAALAILQDFEQSLQALPASTWSQ